MNCNISIFKYEKYKSILKRIIEVLRDRTIIYLILVLAIFLSTAELYHNIRVEYDNEWIVQLHRLIPSMLFALPILFLKKKILIFPYLIAITLYFLSIIWYLRTYHTIMPLGSYLLINNLDGLWPSIWSSIRGKDFFIILPIICFSFFYTYISKQCYWRLWSKYNSLIISIIICGATIFYAQKSYYKKGYNILTITGHFALEPLRAFKEFGIANFWIYQIMSRRDVSAKEKEYAKFFIENSSHKRDNLNTTIKSDKNLILILIESFQSWLINRNISGIEITPYINKLIKLDKTIYFPKEVPQVKDGRSSDAQLIINTGLLPLETGAASSLCSENHFPSLPEALKDKGYTSITLLCDNKEFWNQEVMAYSYHFNYLYDNLKGNEGVEKADENLFKKAIPIFKELKQPFYAQLVTISSHPPYFKALTNSPLEKDTTLVNDEVKYYIIAAQYVDQCIADFIENLKAVDLYDNSIIVITGDHEAVTFNQYEGREELTATDCYVPFIILNSPLASKHTNKVIGQIDIYPTLLEIMGCNSYYFKGLGENIFSDSISNFATYRTGIIAEGYSNTPDSVKKYRQECWKVSDILLRMNYFNNIQNRVKKNNPLTFAH